MVRIPRSLAAAAVAVCLGCSPAFDLDEVPVGSDVQLTREDGGLVEGRLLDRTPERVTVDVGTATRDIAREEIADVRVVEADEPPPPPPPAARFREVTLPEGTALQLELLSAVNTGTSAVGDSVVATLAEPVSIEGAEVLPGGARVTGEVLAVQPAGKVKGRASLALVFTSVDSDGETYPISARFEMVAPATKADDAKKIGIPAAGGAVLGAILGGKKGAAVGAAVGGGAGTAVVVMTPGDEVRLAEGTTLKVTLADAVDVRVPIQR
jgi:hypothetical protein